MRKLMAVLSAAVLTATGFFSYHIYSTPYPTAPSETCGTGFHLTAIGPGLDNLSLEDDYAQYQWALKNDGNLSQTEQKLNFASIDDAYIRRGNGRIAAIALPPLGPSNFSAIKTQAYPGIDIHIRDAWAQYESIPNKRPVTVALIDTGVDISHPELKNAIWTNADEIPDDGIDNDGNGYIDDVHGWNFLANTNQIYVGREDVHGTHAAGTIGASKKDGGIMGITDNSYVKIMVLKALGGEEGSGSPESVISAIRYAEANGAQICNLSFGAREVTQEFIDTIKNSSMLFIVSAGNGDIYEIGYDIDKYPVYPASLPFDNVLTVANLLFDGSLDDSSNYGPYSVDIAAPGVMILSTIPENSYGFMSGTSMAAPMVTGAAAMVYSARPDIDLLTLKNILIYSAHRLSPLKGRMISSGMLDVTAALNWGK